MISESQYPTSDVPGTEILWSRLGPKKKAQTQVTFARARRLIQQRGPLTARTISLRERGVPEGVIVQHERFIDHIGPRRSLVGHWLLAARNGGFQMDEMTLDIHRTDDSRIYVGHFDYYDVRGTMIISAWEDALRGYHDRQIVQYPVLLENEDPGAEEERRTFHLEWSGRETGENTIVAPGRRHKGTIDFSPPYTQLVVDMHNGEVKKIGSPFTVYKIADVPQTRPNAWSSFT